MATMHYIFYRFTISFLCQRMARVLLLYSGSILLSLICSICFIFFPKVIWPIYPFVWLIPVLFVLHGFVVVIVCLCGRHWSLLLKGCLLVMVELLMLLASLFLKVFLCAIYNDDTSLSETHTNSYEGSEQAYLEIRSACPVIRHPLLNGGTVGAGEFLGFSFGVSNKTINASNFETNGDSLVVFKSLESPYMEWFDRVSLWHNQDHRLYRIDVQGQMPEDFSARQRYGFYNALTNDLGNGFGVSLTRLPYRPDMPYDATGTVTHLQFHVNIGRKDCRMSIVSQYKKTERGRVTLSDGMIKINAEDL